MLKYLITYQAGSCTGRHGWPALQKLSRPLSYISELHFIEEGDAHQKKFGASKEAARDCTLSVDVTVTFTADHAAKKESMLSDVQVSGVKASEAQEGLVVAR